MRLLGVLRLVVWVTALRHGFALLRLGWSNARVLRRYVAGEKAPSLQVEVWLPLRRYARLFRPSGLFAGPNHKEMERFRRVRNRLNHACWGHQPAFDRLTGLCARRLQAVLIRTLFQRLFCLRLQPTEAQLLADYGSAGQAAMDFLEYANCFGWSTPLALPLELFICEVHERRVQAPSRHGILRTLAALSSLYRSTGPLGRARAIWSGAERLIWRMHLASQDRRHRKLRLAAARSACSQESRVAAASIRRIVLTEQDSLVVVLRQEMLFQAASELLQLRTQTPELQRDRERFQSAWNDLLKNCDSDSPDYFREENEYARNVA